MEHEIEVTVRRFTEGVDKTGYPNQVEVYHTSRVVRDGDPNYFDVFDDIKLAATNKIEDDIALNCNHETMYEDDLEVCPACGETAMQIAAEKAEDRLDDEAHEHYYATKEGSDEGSI